MRNFFSSTPKSKSSESLSDTYSNEERLIAFARLAAYVCNTNGVNPIKSRLYDYVLFKLTKGNVDKAREINISMSQYNASMPFAQFKGHIAPLLTSPKTLCFVWRLIFELQLKDTDVFGRLVKEYKLDDFHVRRIQSLTENSGDMKETDIYDSYLDIYANDESPAENDSKDDNEDLEYDDCEDGDEDEVEEEDEDDENKFYEVSLIPGCKSSGAVKFLCKTFGYHKDSVKHILYDGGSITQFKYLEDAQEFIKKYTAAGGFAIYTRVEEERM